MLTSSGSRAGPTRPSACPRQSLEQLRRVAHEACRLLHGLSFVLAELDLLAVLALVSLHAVDSREPHGGLDALFLPRRGAVRVLMEKESPVNHLVPVQLVHKVQVHQCPDFVSSDDVWVSLRVVESLPRAPPGAHR